MKAIIVICLFWIPFQLHASLVYTQIGGNWIQTLEEEPTEAERQGEQQGTEDELLEFDPDAEQQETTE